MFHDDQHGTAIIVLAALLNALRVVGKRAEDIRVVVVGAGAAGVACSEIMLAHGVHDLLVCDIDGALTPAVPGWTRCATTRPPDQPRRPPRDGRASCWPAPT